MADTKAIATGQEVLEKAPVTVAELSEKQLDNDAHQATDAEHNITIREAFRKYNRAVLWSVLISTTVVVSTSRASTRPWPGRIAMPSCC